MNSVCLTGRLTRDPKTTYTQGAETQAVTRYTLAVNRRFRREGEDNADFISCVSFGKTAEFAEKYFRQGMKIEIRGRIQTGNYTDRDGRKVYTTEIVVEEQDFGESRAASDQSRASVDVTPQQAQAPHEAPQQQHPRQEPTQAAKDDFMAIFDAVDDEGLPFA